MADQIVASSSKALRDPSYVFRPPPLQVTAQDVYDRRAKGGQLVQAGLAETPFYFLFFYFSVFGLFGILKATHNFALQQYYST
jgi:hypothetical protein